MCGRFSLITDIDLIIAQFGITEAGDMSDFTYRYNIAPSQQITAVINNNGARRLGQLQWGLVPYWAKDKNIGYKMINARAESLHEKPSYKHLLARKRCLILADSFYEWKKRDGRKTPVRIHLKDERPFAFAGLWDSWRSPEGDSLFTCTIITTESNPFMRDIHHRMPVILNAEGEQHWLDPANNHYSQLEPILAPLSQPDLACYEVSTLVNSPKNDVPECIQPIG